MLRSFFSCLFLVLAFGLMGQQPTQQGLIKPKPDFSVHEIKVGFNAIRAGRTAFGSGLTTNELEGILAFHQWNLVLDVGTHSQTFGETYDYTNKGNYFRVGTDWNFVKDKPSGNVLSLGLRYARAGFEDELRYTSDQGFGTSNYAFENTDLSARWGEVTFNLRGKVVSDLYMGFTMRWQFARKINGEGVLETYEIPGFGKTKRKNSTAFDYYIMWRLPFGLKEK